MYSCNTGFNILETGMPLFLAIVRSSFNMYGLMP